MKVMVFVAWCVFVVVFFRDIDVEDGAAVVTVEKVVFLWFEYF